jgi:hypothetical protein
LVSAALRIAQPYDRKVTEDHDRDGANGLIHPTPGGFKNGAPDFPKRPTLTDPDSSLWQSSLEAGVCQFINRYRELEFSSLCHRVPISGDPSLESPKSPAQGRHLQA